jgi:transketolase
MTTDAQIRDRPAQSDQAASLPDGRARGFGSPTGEPAIDTLAINTIRTLAMDAVQKANSGHPGTPMALAPVAYTIWQDFLKYDPEDPAWPNRDRFVLSNGHASMLLYAVLFLAGVKEVGKDGRLTGEAAVSLDDIKAFRQLDSKCPGHPEYRLTTGVETTTGPLGQGVATSVGMALAERFLAAHFNRPDFPIVDHDIFAICGDGDMMEGISSEAASIAGHLKLSNLCWLYDSNRITIEGHTDLTFSEDVATRFMGYGWNVLKVSDANDGELLSRAIDSFKATTDRPTFIIVESHIGYGAPHKQDTSAAHGEPLGVDEIRLAKKSYGWPEDAQFLVPDGVRERFAERLGARGRRLHDDWTRLYASYREAYPELAAQFDLVQSGGLPEGWDADIPTFAADEKGIASRDSSAKVMNAIAARIPWMIGGSADLTPSTKTRLTAPGAGDFEARDYAGRNLHFGIREHAMGAICNGLALSELRSFGSTFLIFSDYMKPAIRLAAIMEVPVIFVFTHDSIGVGEDGPTHQPVEQLVGLRSIPGLVTFRPADANEVTETWRTILGFERQPCCIVLTRQPIPTFDRTRYRSAAGVARGAYILADASDGMPDVILMATGSEVQLCISAYEQLYKDGINARVVSMPSWELFERQDEDYRHHVLPPQVKARLAVEQAATIGWDRYVGLEGATIGMHSFGASAPLKALLTKFGFTPEQIVSKAKSLIEKHGTRIS